MDNLKRLKEIITSCESLEELINAMPFFSQEVNSSYLRSDLTNYERPALSFSIREGDKLVISNNQIRVSSLEYKYYNLYKINNKIYSHKVIQKEVTDLQEPFQCLEQYEFVGTTILAFDELRPLHELNHFKSKEEALDGLSNISLSKEVRFLGKIFFNKNGESIKKNPQAHYQLFVSGVEKTRLSTKDTFEFSSCGLLVPPKESSTWENKDNSLIHHQYYIKSKPIDELHQITDQKEIDTLFTFDYFIKGDSKKIKLDKEKMDSEIDGFYARRKTKKKKEK